MAAPEHDPGNSENRALAPWARALLRVACKGYVLLSTTHEKRGLHMRTGLIQGAMIGVELCRPYGDTLKYTKAPGGLWLAYDFNRPQVFPKVHQQGKLSQAFRGSLVAYCVEQTAGQSADTLSPPGQYDLFSFDVLSSQDSYTPAQLVSQGMLAATTQAHAFENVGRATDIPLLEAHGTADNPVFQVTPKGNGLVQLVGNGGDPQPKEDPSTASTWVSMPTAIPAF